jgi:hypothetical protein
MLKPWVKLPAGDGASLWGDMLEKEGRRKPENKVVDGISQVNGEEGGRQEGEIVRGELRPETAFMLTNVWIEIGER